MQQNDLGWSATQYPEFWGRTLDDGVDLRQVFYAYFLTIHKNRFDISDKIKYLNCREHKIRR